MRILIDTHIYLWSLTNEDRLSKSMKTLLTAGDTEVFLSVASLWELAIKHSHGKLKLKIPFKDLATVELKNNFINILPISPAHTIEVAKLPHFHKDPFDRIIIAQAITEDLPVLTVDPQFDLYPIKRIP